MDRMRVSLYTTTIVAKLHKINGETEIIEFEGFRKAKRAALVKMGDGLSGVFGATFELIDGAFLKEMIGRRERV